MKFWKKKLGCPSKKDILYNKKVSNIDLDNLLEELIVLLLCQICANPEIEIYKGKKKIFIKCKACGNERNVDDNLKKILLTECI